MMRKIIHIDESKCNGCGACAQACHEGAIAMIDNKAKLMRDDYCDGLGDCLPTCPTGAITFIHRDAAPYDQAAVTANMAAKVELEPLPCGCPGSLSRQLKPASQTGTTSVPNPTTSQLGNWPVQIQLAPVNAPYFNGANLLIAADCTAYAYAGFHDKFMKNKLTLIGCPKLDDTNYAEKLTQIITHNDIGSISVIRMEVPCCGGLEMAVKQAVADSGKMLPTQIVTISTEGDII